jgi:pimeloyl-ACP methyl ester carboxylesterase
MEEKILIVLILVHGIMGWGENPQDSKQDQMKVYYYGVQPFLQKEYGSTINLVMVAPTLPRADSVKNRGTALKAAIEEELKKRPAGTRVHILAHSMGGLDSRWVIAEGGLADSVASLTTIATPHRGTTLGDLAYDELPILMPAGEFLGALYKIRRRIWRALPFTRAADPDHLVFFNQMLIGFDSTPDRLYAGVRALTLEGAADLNRGLAEKERSILARTDKPVRYFAYGGIPDGDQVPLLRPTRRFIDVLGTQEERKWGDPKENKPGNDGAVSVWSAHFPWDNEGRYYVKTVPYDHFAQINWRIPEDRKPDQQEMSEGLKAVYREIMDNILQVQRMQQPGKATP